MRERERERERETAIVQKKKFKKLLYRIVSSICIRGDTNTHTHTRARAHTQERNVQSTIKQSWILDI
jgi:hypothetical protein